MYPSRKSVMYEPLAENDDDDFDATLLDDIDFVGETKTQEDDVMDANDHVDEEAELEGKRAVSEAISTQGNLSMNIAAVRQRNSRDTKKQLIQSWQDRVEDLEKFFAYYKRKEASKKRINEHRAAIRAARAHIMKTERINLELLTRLEGRILLKRFLQDWLASQSPQKNRPSPMETTLLQDEKGRTSGSLYMTNRAFKMSNLEFPPELVHEDVEDYVEVKLHLDEDDHGTCIHAVECHVQFTIDANFENVAKTWWFDLVESTPLLTSTIVEKFKENIMYVSQEHTRAKVKRLTIAGAFMDEEKDRITITQTGIALDERFPFVEGENRSNGMQWVVFQHITDRLTLVRWTIVNFCPVNANGPLSLSEVAEFLQYRVYPNDSEESLLVKIQSGFDNILTNLRDQFRHRCSRFKLEPTTLGSRELPVESHRHVNVR
ncbi:hypothetical protein AeRB84_008181 [Aphanomyces euteiches]|nr:hypothetical protein AeRB84_008181 [Aphanomyces euteiches]